jgi:hypothetical protein
VSPQRRRLVELTVRASLYLDQGGQELPTPGQERASRDRPLVDAGQPRICTRAFKALRRSGAFGWTPEGTLRRMIYPKTFLVRAGGQHCVSAEPPGRQDVGCHKRVPADAFWLRVDVSLHARATSRNARI